MRLLPLLLALACAGPTTPSVNTGVPAQPTGPALHGERVDVTLPEFQGVVSADGSPRGRDALLGQPVALWFFPAAGTPG